MGLALDVDELSLQVPTIPKLQLRKRETLKWALHQTLTLSAVSSSSLSLQSTLCFQSGLSLAFYCALHIATTIWIKRIQSAMTKNTMSGGSLIREIVWS